MPDWALLRGVDVFAQLALEDLERISQGMRELEVPAGRLLFRHGDPADGMYVVASGSVELARGTSADQDGATQLLAEGEACGDVALFSGEVHAATATVRADARLLFLPKDEFERLVAARPAIMRTMLAAISRRITQVNRELATDQTGADDAVANGHLIAVFSPRGGAGKTTVATHLARQFGQTRSGGVALFDLDLVFDDAAFLMRARPAASLASVAEGDLGQLEKRIPGTLLAAHDGQLRVLVAAQSPEDGERVTGTHVRAALAALKRQFSVVVIDCGSTLGEPTLVPLEVANRVVIVCTPDLAALRDVRECQRIFGQAVQLDPRRVTYCLNHPQPVTGLTSAQFASALEQPLIVEIPYAADLPPRPPSHTAFSRAIEQLANEIKPPEPLASSGTRRAPTRPRGLMRLFRRYAS